jgi:hypothetical protein
MYTGRELYIIGPLNVRLGTRVRVLIASDPDYGDTEAEDGQPESTLTEEEIRFWQCVLDRQTALLSSEQRTGG